MRHSSLIGFYISVSFLSLGNFLLFVFHTSKKLYDVFLTGFLNDVVFNWVTCTMTLSYVALDAG